MSLSEVAVAGMDRLKGGQDDEWALRKLIVLNPQWLGDVFATVVTANSTNKPKKPGQLDADDIKKAWGDAYVEEQWPALLELMRHFDVVYAARGRSGAGLGYDIVPAMLPPSPPDAVQQALVPFDKRSISVGEALCLQLKLKHLPAQVFPKLHSRIPKVAPPVEGTLWRYGGVFCDGEAKGSHALVWLPKTTEQANAVVEVRVSNGRTVHSSKPRSTIPDTLSCTVTVLCVQILAVGPQPHALLWQLYQVIATTFTKENVVVTNKFVACPRCRQTTLPLKNAQAQARKDAKQPLTKECNYNCKLGPFRGPCANPDAGGTEEDGDGDQDEAEDDTTRFDISCFAVWPTEDVAHKNMPKVLRVAYKRAISSSRDLEHACRITTQ